MKSQRHFPITDRKSNETIAFQAGKAIDAGEFIKQAEALSRKLPNHRYVFNLFTNRFEYLLGFCAAIIAGQCTLMPPNRLEKTLEQLANRYPDSYFLDDIGLLEKNTNPIGNGTRGSGAKDGDMPLIPSDQLCAVAFTSGSTGEPNPNLKYWETLRTGSLGNARLMLKQGNERLNILATVPPQHMWGLETSILLPLFSNVAICDLTPFYPQDIADALKSLPSPRALVSSPVHLNVLLKSGVSLVDIGWIYSATAPMSVELATQLESQFGTRVFEVFGCSESGILAGRFTSQQSIWTLSELFELEIKDEGVLIKAEHLPTNVLMQDRIELVGNNGFKWLGRQHDMVNIAGKRGSLADLNRRLLAIEGVKDGVIFLPDDESARLAAMVVAPGLKPSGILEQMKLVVDPVFLPRPVLLVKELPRQETGKLAIKELKSLYESILRTRNSVHH